MQKGVNVDRIHRQHKKHATKAMVTQHQHRATSYYLNQSKDDVPENVDTDAIAGAIVKRAEYIEGMLVGAIEGFTSPFNTDCRDALTNTVTSSFDVLANINFYKPSELAKFNLANINLTEASNGVFTYCDITHLTAQYSTLVDYENPDQYIVLGSRIMGVFAGQWGPYRECMIEGKERGIGYDVGYCGGELASLFLDTKL